MPNLQEAVQSLLEECFSEVRMVVWYDPGGTLRTLLPEEIIPTDVELFCFQGSYLSIRNEIEKEKDFSKKRLIYVDEAPQDPSWLLDYESMGMKIELDLMELLKKSFGLKPSPELKSYLEPENARMITENWDEVLGRAETPMKEEQIREGLLAATLQQRGPFDAKRAVISILSGGETLTQRITTRSLEDLLMGTLSSKAGFPRLPGLDTKRMAATLLLSELNSRTQVGEEEWKSTLPDPPKRGLWASAAEEWSEIEPKSFVEASTAVERDYSVAEKLSPSPELVEVSSFGAVDEILLEEVKTRVKSQKNAVDGILSNADYLIDLAKKRSPRIWAKMGHAPQWATIRTATTLIQMVQSAEGLVDKDLDGLLEYYFSEGYQVDGLYRELLFVETQSDPDTQKLFSNTAKKSYQFWLTIVNSRLSKLVNKLDTWPPKDWEHQARFWETLVKPRLQKEKVAVFLVDALRYDLLVELTNKLKDNHDVKSKPMLASLPSITEVCMATLLPHSTRSLRLKDGKISMILDGASVATREERTKYLRSLYGNQISFMDLTEIESGKKPIGSATTKILVVMDREIDRAGSLIGSGLVSRLERFTERLSRGIVQLFGEGFDRVIVGTDHGFLLIPEPSQVDSIQTQDWGHKVSISRRYAVGQIPPLSEGIFISLKNLGYHDEASLGIFLPEAIRFISRGGSKESYSHGGLSLQECCIGTMDIQPRITETKVKIRVDAPDPITAAIFTVTLVPRSEGLDRAPRKVIIEAYSEEELITSTDPVEVCYVKIPVKLKLTTLPKKVKICAKDAETSEIVDTETVNIALEGYSDLL